MSEIKIHVLHCGQIRTTRWLPFNNDHVSMPRVAGIGVPKKDWCWLPVSCYYIEHPKGKILVDTAWSRRMSPGGVEDKQAQIRELGYLLYRINQGFTPKGKTVDEQLKALGVNTSDLDYVILTHLDCDHACGLHQVAELLDYEESDMAGNRHGTDAVRTGRSRCRLLLPKPSRCLLRSHNEGNWHIKCSALPSSRKG